MPDPYRLIRPLLFQLAPETAHDLVMKRLAALGSQTAILRFLEKIYHSKVPQLPVEVMGIRFPHPVGLAAGLDKQGNAGNAFHALGFAWVEFGTVTPLPQDGNPKPRMFRLQKHDAIINRMGFNSCGLETFMSNVVATSPNVIKGINIGKNAATPIENATSDYLACLDVVYLQADYITVNISSPNTKNLRALQSDDALDQLLGAISQRRKMLADEHGKYVPLVLKIAPDLESEQIRVITQLLRSHGIDAVAATNTTIDKSAVAGHVHGNQDGGLSGAPVRQQSTAIIAALHKELGGSIPIIGMGGIDSAETALEKLAAGASLLQLYTGFIYQGPALIGQINKLLLQQGDARETDVSRRFADWLKQKHSL